MKTRDEVIAINKLIEDERNRLQSIAEILNNIEDKGEINETVIRSLVNASSELGSIVEQLTWRYINALKQGHILDNF